MSRHRFFAPPSSSELDRIRLDASESHHLRHVLRLRSGAIIQVFDGQGNEYICQLDGFDQGHACLSILDRTQPVVESPLDLTLAQAVTKGEIFEIIIQKATELGVRRFVPLMTARTLSSGLRSVSPQRQARWRRIALEATKQCGRTRVMEIREPLPWPEFLGNWPQPALICSEQGGRGLADLQADWSEEAPPRCLLIGPEGGWQTDELETARAAGAIEISLGPRILRAETAAIIAVGLVQYVFGDLRDRRVQ